MFASMNDQQLCAASRRGQTDAFVELVRRYEGSVCAVAYAVTQRRDVSEDVAQETFIVAWKRLPAIEAPERVGGWLAGIARNIARRSRPSGRVEPLTEADTRATEDPGQEDVMVEQENREHVRQMLGQLPLRYREALVLYYRDEQSAARVGDLLGISTSAAEQRISRGRRMLHAKLERAVQRELERTRPDAKFRRRVAAALPALKSLTPAAAAPAAASATTALGKLIAMKKILIVAIALIAVAAAYAIRSSPANPAHELADSTSSGESSITSLSRANKGAVVSPTRLEGTVSSAGGPLLGAMVLVLDEAGAPVHLPSDNGPGDLAGVRVPAGGDWALEGLPPGVYTVVATAPRHLPATSEALELTSEQTISAIDLTLTQGGQTISGMVNDAGGGPVEGAFVRATRPGTPPAATMTAADGTYALTLPGGAYVLKADEPDYEGQSRRVTLRSSDRVIDFQLIPGAAIFGTVVGRTTGEPVAGAVVSFDRKFRSGGGFASGRSADHERVTTDARGRFSLRKLKAAEYALYATADHAASRAPTTVAIGVAEQENDVLILVDPAYNVTGRVVDQANPAAGVADVDIEAFGYGGGEVSVETRTDEDGVFVLEGLNPGSYPLTVRGGDVVSTNASIEITHGDLSETTVPVERGSTLRGRLDPPAAGTLTLKVPADILGRDRFELSQRVRAASAQAGSDGTFELNAVPAGRWALVATANDGSQGDIEIDIPEGGLEETVRVETNRRPFIAGTLLDRDGQPVIGATLTVVPYAEGASPAELFFMSRSPVKTTSDPEGAFSLVGLNPASYRLTIEDRSGAALVGSDGGAFPLLTVEESPLEDTRVVVAPSDGAISGVVRGADGEPFGEAWIEVIGRDETIPNELRTPTLSDRSGNFSFEGLRPGQYDIYAASTSGDATASLEGVELGPHDITLEPLGSISGTVTADGVAVELFTVRTGDLSLRSFSSRAGRFDLHRIATGSQRVVVTAAAGAGSTTVDVTGDEEVQVRVELAPWGSVKGRVLDEGGEPMVGAELSVQAEGGRRTIQSLAHRPVTDANGRFSIDGIGAGTVRVDVLVAADDAQPLRGSLRGVVTAAQQSDLGDATVHPTSPTQ